jgi:hypothetical protein
MIKNKIIKNKNNIKQNNNNKIKKIVKKNNLKGQ